MEPINVAFILPALRPTGRLTEILAGLLAELRGRGHIRPQLVVVDDGSGPAFAEPFAAAAALPRCVVLRHPANQGKGRALKTAFQFCLGLAGLVCAVTLDADGQHLPADALRCAEAGLARPGTLVLGARDFEGPQVPFKSRYGNKITRRLLALLCGLPVTDTQTGLRCLPAPLLPRLLSLPGERYEFELNVLLEAHKCSVPFWEIPIQTLYLDGNAGSHFNPLLDSARIYALLVKYALDAFKNRNGHL